MKVAIIGSGASGLSCAYRLNQLGVKPTIFERKPVIGESINLFGLHLHSFNHSLANPLHSLEKNYGLIIKPMDKIRKMTMFAAEKEVTVKGNLGYIFNRGAERTSLELQIFNQVEAEFYMDTYIMDTMVEDMAKQFDCVVVASGHIDIPDYFSIVKESLIIPVRSAIMEGQYEQGKVTAWVKTEYSSNTYVYLVPICKTKASFTLMADNVTISDLDYYWKQMIVKESIQNNILETWDSEYHTCRLKMNQVRNIYFIGNAGGMTDDYIGFGIINGIMGGIYAAEAIVLGKSFKKSIHPIIKQVDQLHNLRLITNKLDKKAWKRFITLMGAPGIRHLVYKHPLIKFHHLGGMIGAFIKDHEHPV